MKIEQKERSTTTGGLIKGGVSDVRIVFPFGKLSMQLNLRSAVQSDRSPQLLQPTSQDFRFPG